MKHATAPAYISKLFLVLAIALAAVIMTPGCQMSDTDRANAIRYGRAVEAGGSAGAGAAEDGADVIETGIAASQGVLTAIGLPHYAVAVGLLGSIFGVFKHRKEVKNRNAIAAGTTFSDDTTLGRLSPDFAEAFQTSPADRPSITPPSNTAGVAPTPGV